MTTIRVKPAEGGECGRGGCDAAADLDSTTRVGANTWTRRLDCFAHAPQHILEAADKAAQE